MSQITITKGKLLKGDKLEIEWRQKDSNTSKPDECSKVSTNPPHKDLRTAFADLAIHAALLSEMVPLDEVPDIKSPDEKITSIFNVSGFTVIGEDDDEGVILTAQKTLKSGKTLGFNTPIIRFNDESENVYPHMDELVESVSRCTDEIRGYLNGKHADDAQLKMDLP